MTQFTADVIGECDLWASVPLRSLADCAGAQTLGQLRLEGSYECAILACDDSKIASLNEDFRGKPTPTNVLSWPVEELVPPAKPTDLELGDLAIAFETCKAEADQAGIPLDHHVTHLIVHGLLHLLGYDHIQDVDAEVMERLEVQILAKLDVPNPYGRYEED